MRRYNCTYRLGYLYPPQELLRVATILQEYSKHAIHFIDAVFEKKGLGKIADFLITEDINLIITLLGMEYIENDYKAIKELKKTKPGLQVIAIGFAAYTHKKQLEGIDCILDKGFETRIFRALNTDYIVDDLKQEEQLDVAHNPNIIRHVNRDFIAHNHYSDLFVKGKTAWLFFAFGCPFACNYCVKTYGLDMLLKRKHEYVFDELMLLSRKGYKNIRFLDDNITVDVIFLRKLDTFLKRKKLRFNFYGFSRLDLLDEQTIMLLKSINFKRLYIGIETLSPAMQIYYGKNLNAGPENLKRICSELKKRGIGIAAWVMFHPLYESINMLSLAARTLSRVGTDLVLLNILTPYTGTKLLELEIRKIHFDSDVTRGNFSLWTTPVRIHRIFWVNYYLSPKTLLKLFTLFFLFPVMAINVIKHIILAQKAPVKAGSYIEA